ncbi:unnamed protein product [Lathyrus sativus]|nr:unnamed protein product [Lathyrus sativus]
MWTSHPDCIKVVEDAWKTNFVGCPMFVLAAKLKFLKEKLKVWNKECFGNVQDNVKMAELALENIQHHIDTDGHTDINQRKMATVAWKVCCQDRKDGGLGIRSLRVLNKANHLVQCWCIMNEIDTWASVVKARVLRKGSVRKSHVFSSVWTGCAEFLEDLLQNSMWMIGKGNKINLWCDNWCGSPLSSSLHLSEAQMVLLKADLSSILSGNSFNLPPGLISFCPELPRMVENIYVNCLKEDWLAWSRSDSGDITVKDAYSYCKHSGNACVWGNSIWHSNIPPSHSILFWRVINNRVPTDDVLRHCGMAGPSICNLCLHTEENINHLFFQCDYSRRIWNWLRDMLNVNVSFSDMQDCFIAMHKTGVAQCMVVYRASIIAVVNNIWRARNQAQFQNRFIPWRTTCSSIYATSQLAGNSFKGASSMDIGDFQVLKKFSISINPVNPKMCVEVIWNPPPNGWIKVNIDGASGGDPINAACGGIFRDHFGNHIESFACNLGPVNSLFAELMGAILAIEHALVRGWSNIWLESDSTLVVMAFSKPSVVPWKIRNRWDNCTATLGNCNFLASHIFREGNHCADKLANIGLNISNFTWWNDVHRDIESDFCRNRLGLSNFRIR